MEDAVDYVELEADREFTDKLYRDLQRAVNPVNHGGMTSRAIAIQAAKKYLEHASRRLIGYVRANALHPKHAIAAGLYESRKRLHEQREGPWRRVLLRAEEIVKSSLFSKFAAIKSIGFLFELHGLFEVAEYELQNGLDRHCYNCHEKIREN